MTRCFREITNLGHVQTDSGLYVGKLKYVQPNNNIRYQRHNVLFLPIADSSNISLVLFKGAYVVQKRINCFASSQSRSVQLCG